ncbi:MAG: cyclic nucleotide-binding domain-containing protein [Candidatus Firestonebacteria bacterium]|nr:cyclic nucleotide-binding domain-containing protein [Candidatus Firestonebacteria bacterium]
MSEENSERRKNKRAKLQFDVYVNMQESGKVLKGRSINLSSGGIAVLMNEFIPLGKNLSLSFKVKGELVFENVEAKIIGSIDIEDSFIYSLEFIDLPGDGAVKISEILEIIYFITKLKLFSGISDAEALCLRESGEVVEYQEEKVIFNEGEEGYAFYAVISGKVKISKKSNIENLSEEVLALIREGEFFGEMALFDEGVRTAKAEAHTKCVLFTITAEKFNALIKVNHQLAIKVLLGFIRTLSKRLKTMNQEIVDLLFSEAAINEIK